MPLIRWAGSKKKLVPNLLAKTPASMGRYIEPFAGSACLFFALKPSKAILGDKNSDLIDTYRTIAKHPIRVLRLATSYPKTAKSYYEVRDKGNKHTSPLRRAANFIYLNRFCFNGLYRTNLEGKFNVPLGSRTGGFLSEIDFRASARALSRATLLCGDFEKTISRARYGDFVYMDPPYALAERIDRNEYGSNSFAIWDIPRLIDSLRQLHEVGARFLLSYAATKDLLGHLPKTRAKRISVRRHIAAEPSKRIITSEVLLDNKDVFGNYPWD